jgi:hypothetical protein
MHISLDWLVDMAERGLLRPAQFSRPQVWTAENVIDLFDSIYRNYPIGTLLAIEQAVPDEDVLLGSVVIHAPSTTHALVLVDGVQRVSAIVGALSQISAQSPGRRFEIFYDIRNDSFAADTSVGAGSFMLPVSEVLRSGFNSWLRNHPFLNEKDIDACWRVRDAFRSYQIPLTVVSGTNAWETAQIIFTRINTSGVMLSRSDLDRASSGQAPWASGTLAEFLIESERSGFGRLQRDLAAQCILALASGGDEIVVNSLGWTRPAQNLSSLPELSQREAASRAYAALIPGIEFLREFAGISHVRLLPYPSILVNIIRFIDRHGPPIGRVAELLRRWVWRSAALQSDVTALYESPEMFLMSPLDSASRLLDTVSSPARLPWRPDTQVADLNQLSGRVNTLAMLSLRPPLLVPLLEGADNGESVRSSEDEVIWVPGISVGTPRVLIPWLDKASSAFTILLPWKYTDSRPNTLGSYLVHPPVDQPELLDAVLSDRIVDNQSLAAHLIDEKALHLLRHGRLDEFVDYRDHKISAVIQRRVQSMARWGFRDHGELPRINDDEYSDRYTDEY